MAKRRIDKAARRKYGRPVLMRIPQALMAPNTALQRFLAPP